MIDEAYCKVARTYRGKGNLKLKNGNELPCQIAIQQVETGLIYITCKLAPKVSHATSLIQSIMNFSAQEIENAYGKTNDGMSFKSQGKLYTINAKLELFSSKSSSLRLLAQQVYLWSENEGHANCYRFSVVNFEFTRNLVLKTPWGKAIVNPMPDYDDLIRRIKAQKGISVTCEVVIELSVNMRLREVASKLDELCRLLSLSRGTTINWINAEECMEGGKACGIILRNTAAWPFSSFPLIDPKEPSDTPLFIEKVYPAYLKLRDKYNLDVAIEQYLDTKRETAYLETRGLTAVALLDFLQGRYAAACGLDKIISGFSKGKNKKLRSYLKEHIVELFPDIKGSDLDEIIGKTSELNRRSYLSLLKLWTSSLGLNISQGELSKIRDTRIALVHKSKFQSNDPDVKIREYFRIIYLIDRAFLKLLGYDGWFRSINLDTLRFERDMLDHDGSIRQ